MEYEHGYELWRVFEEKLQVLKETIFKYYAFSSKTYCFMQKIQNQSSREILCNLVSYIESASSSFQHLENEEIPTAALVMGKFSTSYTIAQKHDLFTFLCELLYFFVYIFRRQQSRSLFNAVVTER